MITDTADTIHRNASRYAATIADHLQRATDQDAWHAAFCVALDETGDVEQSISLADKAGGDNRDSTDAANDDGDTNISDFASHPTERAMDPKTLADLRALLKRKIA